MFRPEKTLNTVRGIHKSPQSAILRRLFCKPLAPAKPKVLLLSNMSPRSLTQHNKFRELVTAFVLTYRFFCAICLSFHPSSPQTQVLHLQLIQASSTLSLVISILRHAIQIPPPPSLSCFRCSDTASDLSSNNCSSNRHNHAHSFFELSVGSGARC